MTLPEEEQPTRKEVLEEFKATRVALENIPDRLERVTKTTGKLVISTVVIVLVIIIIVIGYLWKANNDTNNQNEKFDNFAFCQAQYNRVNAVVSKTRAELNTQLNSAQATRDVQIAKIVSTGKGDINKVFKDYSTALAKIETKRADNPLPAYPECYSKYITQELTPPASGEN